GPAADPAAPWALAGHPACRPRPPVRPAARRHAGAHGLDRPRCCWGGGDCNGGSTRLGKERTRAQGGGTPPPRPPRPAGFGNPITRGWASTGRGNRRWDGGQLAMTQDTRDDRLLGHSRNNTERAAAAKGKVARLARL